MTESNASKATARRMSPWEARYRAHVDTPNECWHLKQLAAEMEKEGEEAWTLFFDLADETDPYCRSEWKHEIERTFLEWEAEEQWDAAASAYELRTGQDAQDLAGYPINDRKHWIAQRVAKLAKQEAAHA